MATHRIIQTPAEVAAAPAKVLSPDGQTVVCRVEGSAPGLYAFNLAGGGVRPLKLDAPGRRHDAPAWSAAGDLLYRVAVDAAPSVVGVIPAFGRGSPLEHQGAAIAVSADGTTLAVADPVAATLTRATATQGNSPFNEKLQKVADLDGTDPTSAMQLEITRDGRYAVLVRCAKPAAPSLWSYPLDGGDGQELVPQLSAPSFLAFSLSKSQIAVLEVRQGPSIASRVYVRPLSAGSLGALRLGPARDLFFSRQAVPLQRPAFSPDGKKVAVLGIATPPLPGGPPPTELAVELWPTAGGRPERALQLQASDLKGSAHFLDSGELAIDGGDRISVVTL